VWFQGELQRAGNLTVTGSQRLHLWCYGLSRGVDRQMGSNMPEEYTAFILRLTVINGKNS